MVLNKKFSQLRQWVGEKVGTSSKTEMGEELAELDSCVEHRASALALMGTSLKWYMKPYSDTKELYLLDSTTNSPNNKLNRAECISKAMKDYANTLPASSDYANVLRTCSECFKGISGLDLGFSRKIEASYLAYIEESLDKIKNYGRVKQKMERRRLYYDSCLNRMHKSKKENASLEEETQKAQAKFEESRGLITSIGKEILEKESKELVGLLSLFKSAIEYHKDCVDRFCVVANSITKIVEGMSPASPRKSIQSIQSGQSSTPWQTHSSRSDAILAEPVPAKEIDAKVQPQPSEEAITAAKYAIAKYNFESEYEGDLTFKKGQRIRVIKEIDESWWEGAIEAPGESTKFGIFPANYCVTSVENDPNDENTTTKSKRISSGLYYNHTANRRSDQQSISIFADSQPSSHTKSNQKGASVLQDEIKDRVSGINASDKPPGVSNVSCSKCSCENFKINPFKANVCGDCYHIH